MRGELSSGHKPTLRRDALGVDNVEVNNTIDWSDFHEKTLQGLFNNDDTYLELISMMCLNDLRSSCDEDVMVLCYVLGMEEVEEGGSFCLSSPLKGASEDSRTRNDMFLMK